MLVRLVDDAPSLSVDIIVNGDRYSIQKGDTVELPDRALSVIEGTPKLQHWVAIVTEEDECS